jgi:phospholipase C
MSQSGTTVGANPRPPDGATRNRLAAVLTVVLLVTVTTIVIATDSTNAGPPSFLTKIDHVVILVMENHAYDSMFGTYCGATSSICPNVGLGIPPGTCIPLYPTNASGPCVQPFNFTANNLSLASNLPHGFPASTGSYDNGTNNNFYLAEKSGLNPFGHYTGATIPVSWDLAEEYGLDDHFFSGTLSYSEPNHWDLMAGTAPAVSIDSGLGATGDPTGPLNGTSETYLNESNATASVQNELLSHPSISWTYFDYGLPPYQTAIHGDAGGDHIGAYDYWNPLGGAAISYTAPLASHYVNRSQFFVNALAGDLPDISWLIPSWNASDHPPESMAAGETFISQVVDSVGAGPDWNTTAIFVTWDEYGGFWDQVVPPSNGDFGYGFRVPLLVVSPYTPAGTMGNGQDESFMSLLHLVEWRFGLGCLGPMDCNAPLPTDMFNFNSTKRPALLVQNWTFAEYPYQPGNTPTRQQLEAFDWAQYNGGVPETAAPYLTPGD